VDYLLELAQDPDLREAIAITAGEQTNLSAEACASLSELQRLQFLAAQHPNAWVIEVLHAFYEHPDLATQVWLPSRRSRGTSPTTPSTSRTWDSS